MKSQQIRAYNKSKADLAEALAFRRAKGDNIGDYNILTSISNDISSENFGRIAGNFSPNSRSSIETILSDGDVITVPTMPYTISVIGEVINPIAFEYSKGLKLNDVIDNAGGYKSYADKSNVYIIKANGLIERPSRNIFTQNSRIEVGDTIIVPRKIIIDRPGLELLVPIMDILSDLTFSAAALESLTSN